MGIALLNPSTALSDALKLTVNAAKSAVAHPWDRKFLGYGMTRHKAAKLRIAPTSLKRLEDKIRDVLKGARGRSLTNVISELNPALRGWMAYFKLTETKRVLEAMLDSIADRIAEMRAKARIFTLDKARKVTLDEL